MARTFKLVHELVDIETDAKNELPNLKADGQFHKDFFASISTGSQEKLGIGRKKVN